VISNTDIERVYTIQPYIKEVDDLLPSGSIDYGRRLGLAATNIFPGRAAQELWCTDMAVVFYDYDELSSSLTANSQMHKRAITRMNLNLIHGSM